MYNHIKNKRINEDIFVYDTTIERVQKCNYLETSVNNDSMEEVRMKIGKA